MRVTLKQQTERSEPMYLGKKIRLERMMQF